MRTKSVAVYAFQNPITADIDHGGDADHLAGAILLGQELARRGVTLVTGGMRDGLMGVVATAALEAGGHVIGIVPKDFPIEDRHPGIMDMRVVNDAYERKREMMRVSDASITMAGGVGTSSEYYNELDIMKEIAKGYADARALGLNPARPVILFDPSGGKFHAPVRTLAKNMGAVKGNSKDLASVKIATNVREALRDAQIITQGEFEQIYSNLAPRVGTTDRQTINAHAKPITKRERKKEFRQAAAMALAGALSLPLGLAVSAHLAGGAKKFLQSDTRPVISESDYRSVRYDDLMKLTELRQRDPKALPTGIPDFERAIFTKMDELAKSPALREQDVIPGEISFMAFLTATGLLIGSSWKKAQANARPAIVIPKIKAAFRPS